MNPALIIVDLQNDYFAGGRMELEGIGEAGRKASQLLAVFRDKKWPTFHIQHISLGSRATFFLPDTQGAEFQSDIAPLPEEPVIQKNYPNSFRDTSLNEKLGNQGIEELMICGAMTHMCIDATTRAAFDLGFKCTVIHDACATRSLEFGGKTIAAEMVHGSFMAALGQAYAGIVSLSEYI